MDRGACRVIVHRVARVGHDLATKPPPPGAQDPRSRAGGDHGGSPSTVTSLCI